MDEGSIAIQPQRLPSVSLPQALALQTEAEKIIKGFPEVIDMAEAFPNTKNPEKAGKPTDGGWFIAK